MLSFVQNFYVSVFIALAIISRMYQIPSSKKTVRWHVSMLNITLVIRNVIVNKFISVFLQESAKQMPPLGLSDCLCSRHLTQKPAFYANWFGDARQDLTYLPLR